MKVTYIDHMGSDLSVVNAARVSFGKTSEFVWYNASKDKEVPMTPEFAGIAELSGYHKKLSKVDQSLVRFLARGCTSGDWDGLLLDLAKNGFDHIRLGDGDNKVHIEYLEETANHIRKMPSHWTPFAHTAISLHLKMPIFVARQIMKTTAGMVYNEVSRRYVDTPPEFFVPEWRSRADNVKQGSGGPLKDPDLDGVEAFYGDVTLLYQEMLERGVAPEQARMILPQSMYTEVIATGNLYSWANLYNQRTDSHAQKETQDLAHQIGSIIAPKFPVSWEALTS